MRDAYICELLRTPVGRYGGTLKDIPTADLAAAVVKALVARSGITSGDVDDVIFGQCYPNGEAPAIGRVAALDAGLDISVPGLQLDRRCGSGLQAVIDAAMRVQTGIADLVIAGGAESMSQAEHYVLGGRFGLKGDSQPFWDRIARGRITAGGKYYPCRAACSKRPKICGANIRYHAKSRTNSPQTLTPRRSRRSSPTSLPKRSFQSKSRRARAPFYLNKTNIHAPIRPSPRSQH